MFFTSINHSCIWTYDQVVGNFDVSYNKYYCRHKETYYRSHPDRHDISPFVLQPTALSMQENHWWSITMLHAHKKLHYDIVRINTLVHNLFNSSNKGCKYKSMSLPGEVPESTTVRWSKVASWTVMGKDYREQVKWQYTVTCRMFKRFETIDW